MRHLLNTFYTYVLQLAFLSTASQSQNHTVYVAANTADSLKTLKRLVCRIYYFIAPVEQNFGIALASQFLQQIENALLLSDVFFCN